MGKHAHVFKQLCFDPLDVVRCVEVSHIARADMQLEVWSEVLVVVVIRKVVWHLSSKCDRCLIGPTTSHVADCVTATSKKEQWNRE